MKNTQRGFASVIIVLLIIVLGVAAAYFTKVGPFALQDTASQTAAVIQEPQPVPNPAVVIRIEGVGRAAVAGAVVEITDVTGIKLISTTGTRGTVEFARSGFVEGSSYKVHVSAQPIEYINKYSYIDNEFVFVMPQSVYRKIVTLKRSDFSFIVKESGTNIPVKNASIRVQARNASYLETYFTNIFGRAEVGYANKFVSLQKYNAEVSAEGYTQKTHPFTFNHSGVVTILLEKQPIPFTVACVVEPRDVMRRNDYFKFTAKTTGDEIGDHFRWTIRGSKEGSKRTLTKSFSTADTYLVRIEVFSSKNELKGTSFCTVRVEEDGMGSDSY